MLAILFFIYINDKSLFSGTKTNIFLGNTMVLYSRIEKLHATKQIQNNWINNPMATRLENNDQPGKNNF